MLKTYGQEGLSLLMVFFIMTALLSAVLGLGIIIFSEIKTSRTVGDSLRAFYLADTGVEQFLYYNRRHIPNNPPDLIRGMCDICSSCQSDDCQNCLAQGDDCLFCKNCRVSYESDLNGNQYAIEALVYPNGNFFNINVSSKGFYNDTSRAIGLQIANKDLSSSAPIISEYSAVRNLQTGVVLISARITDPEGVDPVFSKAHIRNSNDPEVPDIELVPLSTQGGGSDVYEGSWQGASGYYFVYISACDKDHRFANCGQSDRFPITTQ